MEADESYLDNLDMDFELSECINALVKVQALIRGWLVRKHVAEIQALYEQIVNDVDGDDVNVSWSSGQMGLPVVKKYIKKKSNSKPGGMDSRMQLPHEQFVKHQSGTNSTTHKKHNSVSIEQRSKVTTKLETEQLQESIEVVSTSEFEPCLGTQLSTSVETQTFENETSSELYMKPKNDIFPDRATANVPMSSAHSVLPHPVHSGDSKMTSVAVQTEEISFPMHSIPSKDVLEDQDRCGMHSEEPIKLREEDSIIHKDTSRHNITADDNKERQQALKISETCTPTEPENSSQRYSRSTDILSAVLSSQKDVKSKQIAEDADSSAKEMLQNLPDDHVELEQLQKTTAMELLWVQQAIISRKHYLRLRQQLQ